MNQSFGGCTVNLFGAYFIKGEAQKFKLISQILKINLCSRKGGLHLSHCLLSSFSSFSFIHSLTLVIYQQLSICHVLDNFPGVIFFSISLLSITFMVILILLGMEDSSNEKLLISEYSVLSCLCFLFCSLPAAQLSHCVFTYFFLIALGSFSTAF